MKYKWEIVDRYGWEIGIKKCRQMKLDKLEGSNLSEDVEFHLSIYTNSFDVIGAYYSKNILSVKGIKFMCVDIEFAETIIDSICLANNFEVFKKYRK